MEKNNCAYHPYRKAYYKCSECHQMICEDCKTPFLGRGSSFNDSCIPCWLKLSSGFLRDQRGVNLLLFIFLIIFPLILPLIFLLYATPFDELIIVSFFSYSLFFTLYFTIMPLFYFSYRSLKIKTKKRFIESLGGNGNIDEITTEVLDQVVEIGRCSIHPTQNAIFSCRECKKYFCKDCLQMIKLNIADYLELKHPIEINERLIYSRLDGRCAECYYNYLDKRVYGTHTEKVSDICCVIFLVFFGIISLFLIVSDNFYIVSIGLLGFCICFGLAFFFLYKLFVGNDKRLDRIRNKKVEISSQLETNKIKTLTEL